MIQIKTFKSGVSEKLVNKFLVKHGGKIVSYSPIIVEYDVIDEVELPSITLSGLPSTIEMRRENCDTEYSVDINFNKVLFFGNKVVFISGLKEVAEFEFNRGLLKNQEGFNYISNIYVCNEDYDKSYITTDTSPQRLLSSLQEIGLSIVDTHIAYDKRTKFFKDISISIDKLADCTIKGLDNLSKATITSSYINSDMNRRIHNSGNKRIL